MLRVRDTGKGMTAAVLEKLGTPFFTTRAEGNGLGVVLARTVITQHGGQAGVHQHARARAPSPPCSFPNAFPPAAPSPPDRFMGRVLLVDDDPGVLFALSELLEAQGHNVVTAELGQEALGRLDEVDVVVSDLAMPGMSGLELLDQVLAVDPALPFLLLTAHGSEKTAVAAMKRGAYDYLSKPFDNDEVGHGIQRALETRDLRLRARQSSLEESLGVRIVGQQPGAEAGDGHRGRAWPTRT